MKRSYIVPVMLVIFIFLFSLGGCNTAENKETAVTGESAGSTQESYLEEGYEAAVLGGGCFWSMEASFSQLKGIRDAEAGYAGGDRENPTYEEVSSKQTGHAEVVKVVFDPDIISYEKLLEVFFYVHDPTTLNRQGNDIGEQYRSIILYTDPRQENTARDYIEKLEEEGIFAGPIVTQVEPLESYYSAEDYHQEYYENNPDQPYCSIVVGPKVEKFEEKFADLIK
jgi:peptide-methionine (S)-S-oxide reductase